MSTYNSSYRVREKREGYYLRHACRIFIGVLFIFSAYVKGVDPFGFSLKIEEYFLSWGMDFMLPLAQFTACCMLLAEFLIGVAMLFNIQVRFFSWILLLFMLFFLVLTAYLAFITGIVAFINRMAGTAYQVFVPSDCGCFGDFIKLTNMQTFWKNVIFMLPTLVIFAQRKNFKTTPFHYITEWGPLLLATLFMVFMQVHCLRHEPWHDFRPWNKGHFIAAETYSAPPEVDYLFRYRHIQTKELKEITMDELMRITEDSAESAGFEQNYVYVDRVEKVLKAGIDAKLSDFTMLNAETLEDEKLSYIESPGYHFLMIDRDISKSDWRYVEEMNRFALRCKETGIPFVAVTSSLPDKVALMQDSLRLCFPFYYSDATPLKTALRNNLGLLLLKDGYILDKWSFRDLPDFDEFQAYQAKYEASLEKYRLKNPPVLPNGDTLELKNGVEPSADAETLSGNE